MNTIHPNFCLKKDLFERQSNGETEKKRQAGREERISHLPAAHIKVLRFVLATVSLLHVGRELVMVPPLGPCTNVGDPGGVPGARPQSGPVSGFVFVWGVYQRIEDPWNHICH